MNFIRKPIDPTDLLRLEYDNVVRRVLLEWAKKMDALFQAAIREKCGGVMPPEEELRRKGKVYITREGVHHLAWADSHPGLGEQMDTTTIIASMAPPKFHSDA